MKQPNVTHRVTCQDDAGRQQTVDVKAATDQGACTAALKKLNTWRAVSVAPLKGQTDA